MLHDLTPHPMPSTPDYPFAHQTMSERSPNFIKSLQERNNFSQVSNHALDDLYTSMVNNDLIPSQGYLAPDAFYWQNITTETWQSSAWFIAEMIFFRELINSVGYWQTGIDPYYAIKYEELHSDSFQTQLKRALAVTGDDASILKQMIHLALWGNRADLSLPEVVELGQTVEEDDLLIDESDAIVDTILNGTGAIHLITDNFGTELAMDLMLIYHLLRLNMPIKLHVKMNPTYVSDATISDVHWMLSAFPQRVPESQAIVDDIHRALNTGDLAIHPDFYWHSPHFYNALPTHLFTAFEQARVIISKGDANYRRALFDTIWDVETDFASVMQTMPAPFVALRTLKSNPIVGLTQQKAQQLDDISANWRTSGKYGIIQFAP